MAEVTKFEVKIYGLEKPKKVSKEVQAQIKGVAGGKMLKRMKREAVACPLVKDEVAFLACFACGSFIRRFKGTVHCAGIKPPVL